MFAVPNDLELLRFHSMKVYQWNLHVLKYHLCTSFRNIQSPIECTIMIHEVFLFYRIDSPNIQHMLIVDMTFSGNIKWEQIVSFWRFACLQDSTDDQLL